MSRIKGKQLEDDTVTKNKLNLTLPTLSKDPITKEHFDNRKINGKNLSTDITLNLTDVGGNQLDNTSDINKPVSNLQRQAINEKLTYDTIQGFRNNFDTNLDSIHITDINKSGLFKLDLSDTTSIDDGVMILVKNGRRFKREYDGFINVKWFGAKGDGITDDTIAIQKALSFSGGILIDKVFRIGSMNFPSDKTVSFINGGRILVKSGANVLWLSKINASQDDWIFDCEDNPTNYSNQSSNITTTNPLTFKGNIQLSTNITYGIPVKWFGATGGGFNSSMVATYYSNLTVPSSEYKDDTKAIRFALTAIGESGHTTFSGDFAFSGPNKLFFAKGCYCVNEPLYISSGTFIEGVGSSQALGTTLYQINPTKPLFVLQAAGVGGLGGSGSAHNISDMNWSIRPVVGGLGTHTNSLIRFEDQKFNLDSRFSRIRISGCPTGGSVFLINNKNSHYENPNGMGTTIGMYSTFHLYDSMIDVVQGHFITIGENGRVGIRVYNSQFYNIYGALVQSLPKNSVNIEGFNKENYTEFNNCNFEGIGTIGNYSFDINDEFSSLILNNCDSTSLTVDGISLGAPLRVNRAKSLSIIGGSYSLQSTEVNGGLYHLLFSGRINNLTIKNVKYFKYTIEPTTPTINITNNFYSENIDIDNVNFWVTPQTNQIIYSENPNSASKGKISNCVFSSVTNQPIVGNLNTGIVLVNNIFFTIQDPKSISLENYGMKGHTIIYSDSIPTTNGYTGDICFNTNEGDSGIVYWRYDVSQNRWIPSNEISNLISNTNLSLKGNIIPSIPINFNIGDINNKMGSIFSLNSTFNTIVYEVSQTYIDNDAAIAGGVSEGTFYVTPDGSVKRRY